MKRGLGLSFKQLLKFGLVGLMNTAITLAAIFLLMDVLHANYLVSNGIGYALGLVNSFIWNKKWTFRSQGNVIKEATLFLGVFAVCYGIQAGMLALMVERLFVPKEIAQVLAMIVFTGFNFTGNKLLSFRAKDA